jgi:hypothetical protein
LGLQDLRLLLDWLLAALLVTADHDDDRDQIERIRPSITRIESIISKSTKYDANSADKAASARKIPEHPGRDPGVRRIISEYS